jgi:A/G-specific adenine glycosylase
MTVSASTRRLMPACRALETSVTQTKDGTSDDVGSEAGAVSPADVDPQAFAESSWPSEQLDTFRSELLAWYRRHRRELPWRGEQVDPYETWVAEVMLQQTQVSTVVDYYKRWLERFPDVETLARADRDDVMELWEGLGYYRRARFLHESAKEVAEQRDGKLPASAEGLKELKGIGDYTSGAIASIAFDEPVPVVDGNVGRVISRLRRVSGEPTSTDFQHVAWAMAGRLVDPEEPGDFNQAMMELGATVCTPSSPTCMLCPVSDLCEAFEAGDVERYPEPVERRQRQNMRVLSVVVLREAEAGVQALVVRRPADGLFGGLWEFPSLQLDDDSAWKEQLGGSESEGYRIGWAFPDGEQLPIDGIDKVGSVEHLLTHIEMELIICRADVAPQICDEVEGASGQDKAKWVAVTELSDVPMSTAMRKVQRAVLGDG